MILYQKYRVEAEIGTQLLQEMEKSLMMAMAKAMAKNSLTFPIAAQLTM